MHNDVDDTDHANDANRPKPPLLSRIRTLGTHLAISSIGSALSGSFSAVFQEPPKSSNPPFSHHGSSDVEAARTHTGCDKASQEDLEPFEYFDTNSALETSTPTQTRSSSPTASTRLAEVKRIFNNFSWSRQAALHARKPSSDGIQLAPMKPHRRGHNSDYFVDDLLTTPPLTPDTVDDELSPAFSDETDAVSEWNVTPFDQVDDDDDNAMESGRSMDQSVEIKEGKKPERTLAHDTSTKDPTNASVATLDEDDEWFGLEYTLELSSRERSPSDAKSSSVGEHSKSHESWATLRRGTIHPFFEDEDYYQWKNWHRYLDRQDDRRKHRKGIEFKARSKTLAWYYVDEMRTRDVMYWQKEVYGVIARDVKERLDMLFQHRPDPYIPAQKHNFGWYLKRSRSTACLRELQPLPPPHHSRYNHANVSDTLDFDYFYDEISGLDIDDSSVSFGFEG